MPIDRFHEIPFKVSRGEVLTVTGYYSARSSPKGTKYPLRMDFEVVQWPASTTLRDFLYSFTVSWLDGIFLPLQSTDIKWHNMTIRVDSTAQSYQVPLIGKYGHHPGSQTPDRIFEVNLIPLLNSMSKKIFRLRGVADVYEAFDRPGAEDVGLIDQIHNLERALVSPFVLASQDTGGLSAQDETVLRYVKTVGPSKRPSQESKRKTKQLVTQFTAAFCIGFK